MGKKAEGPQHTTRVRLSPTREQVLLLMGYGLEYSSTVNILVSAFNIVNH